MVKLIAVVLTLLTNPPEPVAKLTFRTQTFATMAACELFRKENADRLIEGAEGFVREDLRDPDAKYLVSLECVADPVADQKLDLVLAYDELGDFFHELGLARFGRRVDVVHGGL